MGTIKVVEAVKRFREQTVLDGISIEFYPGKIYGITGYNGSGKTVLFKSICGLVTLDSGQILFDEKILKRDIDMIQNAGVIIDEPAFLRNYSAAKNLAYLYSIKNNVDKAYIHDVLQKVGLDPDSKKKVKNFSLGMKQRLAIAQAIMENPEILILDEPMNGLDKKGIAEMRQIFCKQRDEGKTILLASHNREDIEVLCDEVYEMENGKLSRLR